MDESANPSRTAVCPAFMGIVPNDVARRNAFGVHAIRNGGAVQTAPETWTAHLFDEFDRYVAEILVRDGNRYRCTATGKTLSSADFLKIRDEVIANATMDPTSLAYHMLMESGPNAHASDPCPTCDAAIRLAWGVSPTRRSMGLPVSTEPDAEPDIHPHRVAV